MNKNIDNYIYAFDLSLSNSGVCIFDENGNPIKILSIPTSSKQEHKDRLKQIGDELLKLRKKYKTNLIILESGFSRHAASTQAIFKVVGMVQYLFSDATQITYAPSSIKKIVTGSGRSEKSIVQESVLKMFPYLKFKNEDESDAVSVGLAYFIENNPAKL
jgi:crossover junction endodeoxyribonuclease RuvC